MFNLLLITSGKYHVKLHTNFLLVILLEVESTLWLDLAATISSPYQTYHLRLMFIT